MKFVDNWTWPDQEDHLLEWMANPKNRRMINGRSAYQGKKQEAVRQVCTDLTHMRTAVDVGAHIGLWSFNLAHWFERVHAFEPVENHRACFEKNVMSVEHGADVILHGCALGAKAGSVSMRVDPKSTGGTYVKGAGDIPMHTLDSFGLHDVDLIKIDCEGFEENVVRGGEALIKRDRPVIIVEQKRDFAAKFGLKPQGAVDYLRSLGYKVHSEIGGDYIMIPS
jgi:FkbM family methyltransferase